MGWGGGDGSEKARQRSNIFQLFENVLRTESDLAVHCCQSVSAEPGLHTGRVEKPGRTESRIKLFYLPVEPQNLSQGK